MGVGIDTRLVGGLFYLPSEDERVGGSYDPISLADALGGRGLLMFVADSGRSLRTLANRMAEIRERNPRWALAWLNESGEATGMSLARRSRQGTGSAADDPSIWRGSVNAGASIRAAENLGIGFAKGTSVTLELGDGSALTSQLPATLRFESFTTFELPNGEATPTGPATLDLFTDSPGVFRFSAKLPETCTADIRYGNQNRNGSSTPLSATAFTVPSGEASVRLDPAAALDHRNTGIDLRSGLAVRTGWGTPARKPIVLQTVEGSSVVPQPAGDGSLYLTPAGPFQCTTTEHLVCGLSGAEFLKVDAGSILSFVPDRTLDDTRTAWLSIDSASDRVAYYSQSTSNGFHGIGDPNFLPHFDVSAASLTSGVSIPSMPWLGYSGSAADTADLESRLATNRFDLLLGSRAKQGGGAPEQEPEQTDVVTPSGLRATVQDGEIISLGVIKVADDPMTIDTAAMPALRAALGADDQFIVVTKPPIFRGAMAEEPRIRIDGWTFEFGEEQWLRNGTTMIIKQRIDRSLAELITEPWSWTRAESLNDDPQRAAGELRRWVSDTGADDDPAKRELVERVLDDAAWQGVLFISVPAPLSGLPDDLQMLRTTDGGASDTGLSVLAHHLTVDRRPVDPQAGGSSISGLVEYPSPGDSPGAGVLADGHEFTFTSLRVKFVDTAVVEFGAEAEIALGSFLHTRLDESVAVTLRGRQERRSGGTHYSFDTEISPPLAVAVKDATIAAARISQANLAADDAGLRFSFDGEIDFHGPQTDETDVLGYELLAYGSLDLTVEADTGGSGRRRFAWATDRVELSGTPTAGSLPSQFPLRPVGLLFGDTSDLGALGYKTMRLPSTVSAATLGDRFLGIDHELDLGSMGGLSAVPGFVANMAVFWSPDARRRRLQLGLRFPGVDVGVGGFSLQDIFGINCHAVALDHESKSGAFALRLNGLALDLLGFEIPWGGTINAELAADPNGSRTLGWLGDYRNPTERSEPDENKKRRLPRSTNGVR